MTDQVSRKEGLFEISTCLPGSANSSSLISTHSHNIIDSRVHNIQAYACHALAPCSHMIS